MIKKQIKPDVTFPHFVKDLDRKKGLSFVTPSLGELMFTWLFCDAWLKNTNLKSNPLTADFVNHICTNWRKEASAYIFISTGLLRRALSCACVCAALSFSLPQYSDRCALESLYPRNVLRWQTTLRSPQGPGSYL